MLDRLEPVVLFYMGLVFALSSSLLFTISYNRFPEFYEKNFWGLFSGSIIILIFIFIFTFYLFFEKNKPCIEKRKEFGGLLKQAKKFSPKEGGIYEEKK